MQRITSLRTYIYRYRSDCSCGFTMETWSWLVLGNYKLSRFEGEKAARGSLHRQHKHRAHPELCTHTLEVQSHLQNAAFPRGSMLGEPSSLVSQDEN